MSERPQYFLGFDGGASKTAGAIIDSHGNVISEKSGGPSNFQIIGTARASENILGVANAALAECGLVFADIAGIFLGLTGAGRQSDQERMKKGFEEFLTDHDLPMPWIGVESDALAALEGAFPGKAGLILISGTGSILLAKDKSGSVMRVGGWGRYIGDEGSGYAIGKAGLSALVKDYDGRGIKTTISALVSEALNIETPQLLIRKVYSENFDIASVARIVIDAADDGDEVACSILDDAAQELMSHVRTAVSTIRCEIPIALMGSIISHENALSTRLINLISTEYPAIGICRPEKSAAVGAALLAMKGATRK